LSKTSTYVNTSIIDKFWKNLPIFEKGQYWTYSHETDFLRLLVLLRDGGVYLDTDVIISKTFQPGKFQNNIGYEMVDGERLNGNVLIFDAGHPFLTACLEELMNIYSPREYMGPGPVLVTRVHRTLARQNVTWLPGVLPANTFQPIKWWGVSDTIFNQPPNSSANLVYQRAIEKESYGIHLNNRMTKNFVLREDTLAHQILQSNCLYCAGFGFYHGFEEARVKIENT
jgi:lactosylceramide 4-alpha-galactosyltransferase